MKKMVTCIAFIAILFSGCVGTLAKNELKTPGQSPIRTVKPKCPKVKSDNNQTKVILEKKKKSK